MNNPACLRQKIRQIRDAMPEKTRESASCIICRKVKSWIDARQLRTVFAYYPVGSEVDIRPLLQDLQENGYTVALPRVISPGVMRFYAAENLDDLQEGSFHLMEPPDSWTQVHPEQADVFLVPGLAFSGEMGRIGYGGGFYDRYLPGSPAPRVMVAFACQQADFTPMVHDVPMDFVVTEQKIWTQEVEDA